MRWFIFMYSVLFIILSERTCPLRPIRVYVAHRWDSVRSIERVSFVRYYTWCWAFRHSGCKRTENLRGCVTWVPNITIDFKENTLFFIFFCKEKMIVSRIPIFVYSWRGEPGIVQPSFVNSEHCVVVWWLFLIHISLDQIWKEVLTL